MTSNDRGEGLTGHFSKMCRLEGNNVVKIRTSSVFGDSLFKHAAEVQQGRFFQFGYAPN
jgi:hypothetical protein